MGIDLDDFSDEAILARRWSSFIDGWPGQPALRDMPAIDADENVPVAERIVHAHFFHPQLDVWVIAAIPSREAVFGFGRWAGREADAEWGSWSLQELANIRPYLVERDRTWEPCPIRDIGELALLVLSDEERRDLSELLTGDEFLFGSDGDDE